MPEYLHPGVYIEETSYRGKPIQGVSTSTAGFVGAARKGAEGRATFIPSFAEFRRKFGDPVVKPTGLGDYLGHGVKAFFDNGGARCYVVRTLAADAQWSSNAVDMGIALKLAPGVTIRGVTRVIRLNALRGVGVGTMLNIFTRPDADSAFGAAPRSVVVETYDAQRNIVTVDAASEIPAGVVLEPGNTVILIDTVAPAATTPAGNGVVFMARHRGVDGDGLAVEIRPRDRPPVALTGAGSASRQNAAIALAAAAAAGQTTLEFDAPSLRLLRIGDTIRIGGTGPVTVTAVADGDVTFDVVGGVNGGDHTGAGTLELVERGGTVLGVPVPLGAAAGGFAIDMTGAASFPAAAAIPHDVAMVLRVGDVVRITTGGVITNVTITAVQVAQEIAAGQHVTISAGLTAAEAANAAGSVTVTAGTPERIYVGDASGFAEPARAGAPETVSVRAGNLRDAADILLVDRANNVLYIDRATNTVGLDVWESVDALQALAAGSDTVRVSSTSSFYTGAKVELDSGTAKTEAVVTSIDTAARTVTFAPAAATAIDLDPDAAARRAYLRTSEIDILIYENGVLAEAFNGLTWNSDDTTDAGLRYFVTRLNDEEVGSKLIRVVPPAAPPAVLFSDAPVNPDGLARRLTNGSNGGDLTEIDLIGADLGPGRRTGIKALAERDDISMVAVPGVWAETVQAELITHCELLKYRVAVLDSPPTATDVTALQAHRFNYDSKYAAYYAPWVKALNTFSGRIETFPPAAYAMGIFARSDNTVGVHKAPANEVVRNIVDVALPFTAAEQDVLNPVGINLIRDLTPRGIRLWGARTISSDQEWKYLNFRRLFIYIEHSIDLGTQWVVFEPNSEALWAKVTETISSFLFGVWKSGALMGTTPEQAYFVVCDRTTMSQDDIDNGRLICAIGLAPVAPAEFVIFKIGQFTATSS